MIKKNKYTFFLFLSFFYTHAIAQSSKYIEVNRQEYVSRLKGMWLAENVANWTGIVTEGQKLKAPFYTDKDWGTNQGRKNWGGPKIDFVFHDPWGADDDTDIEYTYLLLMSSLSTPHLSSEEIARGWISHINKWIWVSNQSARDLMSRGVTPPATSLGAANPNYLMIDAQLTTEFFGALCPGMPQKALEISELPIRTTAGGHAAHAAQFHVLLYSLASVVDVKLTKRDQIIWLVKEAQKFLPETSKAYDIVSFILEDYLTNQNVNDWERTRDKVYDRYHLNAEKNGFHYIDWVESSVNFAGGLIALLYGEGDYKRTVQVGVLSGWDSDNGTATMAGVLGLMMGYENFLQEFPDRKLSEDYNIDRTRDRMPDYTPEVAGSKDNINLIARRMIPLIDQIVAEEHGSLSVYQNIWRIPLYNTPSYKDNPLWKEYQSSINNQLRIKGKNITISSNTDKKNINLIIDGIEHDASGKEPDTTKLHYYSSKVSKAENVVITIEYPEIVNAQSIRFIEGDHTESGGWFERIQWEVLSKGEWKTLAKDDYTLSAELDARIPFQIIDLTLTQKTELEGIRISGKAGGIDKFITACELDVLTH